MDIVITSAASLSRDQTSIEVERTRNGATLKLSGRFDWQAVSGARVIFDNPPVNLRCIDLSDVTELDTVGALVLCRLCDRPGRFEFKGVSPALQLFIEQVSRGEHPEEVKAVQQFYARNAHEATQAWPLRWLDKIRALLAFCCASLIIPLIDAVRRRRRHHKSRF